MIKSELNFQWQFKLECAFERPWVIEFTSNGFDSIVLPMRLRFLGMYSWQNALYQFRLGPPSWATILGIRISSIHIYAHIQLEIYVYTVLVGRVAQSWVLINPPTG